jgi:hypothetical protein
VPSVVALFDSHLQELAPASSGKRFGSDKVLEVLRDDLKRLGFDVEHRSDKRTIERPVFFGEGGVPSLRYRVDAFHAGWKCGLEIEAGRGLQGNAFYRDLVQAMVMDQVEHLVIAVLNHYRGGAGSKDYEKAASIARALYGHDRIAMPFGLTVIGYGP